MKETESEYDKMLNALAKFVSEQHRDHPPICQLIESATKLDRYLQQVKVHWKGIASSIQVSRDKLYHWYHETHLRQQAAQKLTAADKQLMYTAIMHGVQDGSICKPEFAVNLRIKLFNGRNIHRSDYSMNYNNIVRSRRVRDALLQNDIKLPNKRRQVPKAHEEQGEQAEQGEQLIKQLVIQFQ